MRTSILRIVCFVFATLMMNSFAAKAQKAFYDIRQEDGKMVSKTMYVRGNFGYYYEAKLMSKFTYDEKGNFLKKEVFVWNPTYKLNIKLWYPDYSEKNWTPKYCVLHQKDSTNNFVSIELFVWNAKKKSYGEAKERMIYQLNDSNLVNYLASQNGDKFEQVNNLKYDKLLLAKLVK